MRILQVSHRYPPQTGGVETHVREISEGLVRRGHDVTVHTADASGDGIRREQQDGVEIRRHRALTAGGAFHVAPGITQAVRKAEVEVVHAHNYHALPLLFAALGITNERFVVTPHYHGGSASGFRDRMLRIYRPVGRRGLRRADAVIAVSEWERNQLVTDFGVDATVIPNGVDVERFAQAEPEVRERPFLLCVGRLEEYKGIQHVIRALPEMPEYDLMIAGEGPFRGELEAVARDEKAVDRVKFLGHVDRERLPGLYAGAEVYVTLSEFEAFGMTVAEALAAGTPCVVRSVGALEDWGERDGCIEVHSTAVDDVVSAVTAAASVTTGTFRGITWDGVVDQLLERYART